MAVLPFANSKPPPASIFFNTSAEAHATLVKEPMSSIACNEQASDGRSQPSPMGKVGPAERRGKRNSLLLTLLFHFPRSLDF